MANLGVVDSWHHPCPISPWTVATLLETQWPTLKALELLKLDDDEDSSLTGKAILPPLQMPSTLRKVVYDAVGQDVGFHWLCNILVDGSSTLKHVGLGAEWYKAQATVYSEDDNEIEWQNKNEYLLDMVQFCTTLAADQHGLDLYETPLLRLDTLELKGLPLAALFRPDFMLVDPRYLSTLRLESCSHMIETLDGFSTRTHPIVLQSVRIRCEDCTPDLTRGLYLALVSFIGLKDLSILLDIPGELGGFRLRKVLEAHGESLRTLVWEERPARQDGVMDPARRSRSLLGDLKDIIRECPDLLELGVALDWVTIMSSGAVSLFPRRYHW